MVKCQRTSNDHQRTSTAIMKHFQQTNHSENLKQMFANYFDSKLFCDLTISCKGKNFEAHKLALSISSPYFRNILQQDPTIHPIVYLPDVTPEEVKFILEFCYKGRITLPKNKLEGFMKACQTLQIKSLFTEDATNGSEECIMSDTDEESNINKDATNNNSTEKLASLETEVEIESDDSPIFKENSNGQINNIKLSPLASYILANSIENSNILESPPSSISTSRNNTTKSFSRIPQNVNEPAHESAPSSPESFVFNLRTSLPVNTETQESVLFLPETCEVWEISSEEFASEIIDIPPDVSKINQDKSVSEEITKVEEDLPSFMKARARPVDASDPDDSEMILSKRIKKNTKATTKQLKVVVHRIDLKETNKDNNDSLMAQQGSREESPQLSKQKKDKTDALQFSEHNFTTEVIDLKDVPEIKKKSYCELCQRCVRPFYMKRHRLKHTLLSLD